MLSLFTPHRPLRPEMTETLLSNEAVIRLGFFFGFLVLMAAWEAATPCRERTQARALRWTSNLGIVVMNTLLVRLLFPVLPVALALIAASLLNSVSVISGLSGLYHLYCTHTTALRGFRLGARCACLREAEAPLRRRQAVVPTHHKRRATTSESLATPPFRVAFPIPSGRRKGLPVGRHRLRTPPCRGNGKSDRMSTIKMIQATGVSRISPMGVD